MEVERWVNAVEEILSRDTTGLGDAESLQDELNQCKVGKDQKNGRFLYFKCIFYNSFFVFVPLPFRSM